MTSATDKAIEIEGFGTTVAPFEKMLEAFQAKFHVEPDVSVRLIEPAQCEITDFLRALGAATSKSPKLSLDRTSVPNGSAISGTLEARGGLRTSMLLIDNKGMAFSLDKHVVVQSGKAIFNVPISLGAVDQAAGKRCLSSSSRSPATSTSRPPSSPIQRPQLSRLPISSQKSGQTARNSPRPPNTSSWAVRAARGY